MRKFLKLMFSPSREVSSMRIFMAICVLTACYVAIVGINKGTDLVGVAAMIGALLTPVFGKAIQSFSERDNVGPQ